MRFVLPAVFSNRLLLALTRMRVEAEPGTAPAPDASAGRRFAAPLAVGCGTGADGGDDAPPCRGRRPADLHG